MARLRQVSNDLLRPLLVAVCKDLNDWITSIYEGIPFTQFLPDRIINLESLDTSFPFRWFEHLTTEPDSSPSYIDLVGSVCRCNCNALLYICNLDLYLHEFNRT